VSARHIESTAECKAVVLSHAGSRGEKSCTSDSFLTSALDEVSGMRHAPAAVYSRERTPVPLKAGWASDLVWIQMLRANFFASAGDRTPVVKSVVRNYIAWATPAPTVSALCTVYGTVENISVQESNLYNKPVWKRVLESIWDLETRTSRKWK
jgi:hypothetical protein